MYWLIISKKYFLKTFWGGKLVEISNFIFDLIFKVPQFRQTIHFLG